MTFHVTVHYQGRQYSSDVENPLADPLVAILLAVLEKHQLPRDPGAWQISFLGHELPLDRPFYKALNKIGYRANLPVPPISLVIRPHSSRRGRDPLAPLFAEFGLEEARQRRVAELFAALLREFRGAAPTPPPAVETPRSATPTPPAPEAAPSPPAAPDGAPPAPAAPVPTATPHGKEAGAEPIPQYRLVQLVGRGGTGDVWECASPDQRRLAIKFFRVDPNVDRAAAQNAWKELIAVKHPFLVEVLQVERKGGDWVLLMELAKGSLRDRLRECQQTGLPGIPRSELLTGLRNAAEALDFLHTGPRWAHLDVKPSNLLCCGDAVKLSDVRPPLDLDVTGFTPAYAAPEVFRQQACPHSDQYSLAITYQELLTGHRPFVGELGPQLLFLHLTGEPDLEWLPPPDRPIVARALAKEPGQRFPSCLAFVEALLRVDDDYDLTMLGQPDQAARAGARPVAQPSSAVVWPPSSSPSDLWKPPTDVGGTSGLGQTLPPGAASSTVGPGAPTLLERRATVRYYSRMNPERTFPLLVVLSDRAIREGVQKDVAQAQSPAFRVGRDLPLEIEPVLPGCECYPPRQAVLVPPGEMTVRFWVVPRILGPIADAHLALRQGGRVLAEVPLQIRVAKQTAALVSGLLTLCLPYGWALVKKYSGFEDDPGLYLQATQFVLAAFSPELCFVLLAAATLGLWWWARPKQRAVFWEVQSLGSQPELRVLPEHTAAS